MNGSGDVATSFSGPHRHQVQEKTDRPEDQQVLLRTQESLFPCCWSYAKALATHLCEEGIRSSLAIFVSLPRRVPCGRHLRACSCLCIMTQRRGP